MCSGRIFSQIYNILKKLSPYKMNDIEDLEVKLQNMNPRRRGSKFHLYESQMMKKFKQIIDST